MANKLMSKVFSWMFIGLLITFFTGIFVGTNEYTTAKLLSGKSYLMLVIVELVLVIVLSVRITKMSPTSARICFLLYSFVTGITFGGIFLAYSLSSVMYTFLMTSLIFGACAVIGYTTKMDLTKMGTYLIVGLFGVIICSIVNIFLKVPALEMILSIVTIIIFLGLTAYDVQKIQKLEGIIPEENLPIYGALELYLDFINIFLKLLQFFGNSKNKN